MSILGLHNLKRLATTEGMMILYRTTADGRREEIIDPALSILQESMILSGSFNPLHEGHIKLAQQACIQTGRKQIIYELAIINADKGPIDEQIIIRRAEQFERAGLNLLLTSQPFFYRKALMLPNQHFVLGYDTFLRLLDVKYYDNSTEKLLQILKSLEDAGTRFSIGGRLNQKTSLFEVLDAEALDIVPPAFKHLFIPVADFRLDISSTELRARGISTIF
jgi:nicotinic acid mononucleotide adenylyltransferase